MSLQEKQTIDFDDVFRDAKSKFFDIKPGLEMNTEKELELLMHKFKQMSTGVLKPNEDIFKDQDLDVEKKLKERRLKRIRIPRWMSKNVAEYDLKNQYWTISEAKIDAPFHPFSNTIYLEDGNFFVIGGLNDKVAKKPAFSNEVYKIVE